MLILDIQIILLIIMLLLLLLIIIIMIIIQASDRGPQARVQGARGAGAWPQSRRGIYKHMYVSLSLSLNIYIYIYNTHNNTNSSYIYIYIYRVSIYIYIYIWVATFIPISMPNIRTANFELRTTWDESRHSYPCPCRKRFYELRTALIRSETCSTNCLWAWACGMGMNVTAHGRRETRVSYMCIYIYIYMYVYIYIYIYTPGLHHKISVFSDTGPGKS